MAPDNNVVSLWDDDPETLPEGTWDGIQWEKWERGQHDGWSMQRYHSLDGTYARVEFTLEGGYPPDAFMARAAGTVWNLVDTVESGDGTVNCYYERR